MLSLPGILEVMEYFLSTVVFHKKKVCNRIEDQARKWLLCLEKFMFNHGSWVALYFLALERNRIVLILA